MSMAGEGARLSGCPQVTSVLAGAGVSGSAQLAARETSARSAPATLGGGVQHW